MAQNFDSKVTSKGTKLPLLNLKGKPYLQVAHRLVWFREENPLGVIKTQILHQQDGWVIVRAEIAVPGTNGVMNLISSAHKMETKENFGDYIEKAETGAIGRALAMAGYGTQFEPEFDEGDRLADSPVDVATKSDISSGAIDSNGAAVSNETKVVRPTFKKKATKTESAEDKI